MAEQEGVAPETQTETENKEDSKFISIGDIAEAAGLDESSFIESAEEEEPVEEVEEEFTEESGNEDQSQSEELTEENTVSEDTVTDGDELTEDLVTDESEGVKKRIGKLIEARKKAEEEANALKEQIANLEKQEPAQPETKGMERFEKIKDYKELQARESEAEHLREWLIENPDGGDYKDPYGNEHEVEYEQARKLMVETDRDLRKNIPQATERLRQREESRSTAMNTFSWMKDPSTPEMQEVQRILQKNKFIKDYYDRDPYGVLTVAYAIEGIKSINQKKAAPHTKKQPVPPKAPIPSRAAPVTRKKSVNKKDLLAKANSGTLEDAASYIEKLLT